MLRGLAEGRPVVEQRDDIGAGFDADRLDGAVDLCKVDHNADGVAAGPGLAAAELPRGDLGSNVDGPVRS